jgi:arsenate reductase
MQRIFTVVFVCPHGAAKSVLAAADFERLADRLGLRVSATAAGTDPDPEVSPAVARALLADGIDVRRHRPRRVTAEELAAARRVVSLGCDLGDLVPPGLHVDRWDDVPPVSADLAAARGAIALHLETLLDECARDQG